jgi:o-succinylbenzoate---CoA ligase
MFDLEFKDHSPRLLRHRRYDSIAQDIIDSLKGYDLRDHFLILSSGTTSKKIKGYALSKKALVANAQAVNTHFNLTAKDTWALSLPSFHVGGLSVLIRAQLTGSRVVETSTWDPQIWSQLLSAEKVTITTVVPTQVFDLVKNKIQAPPDLRYLIVGGDFLSHALEAQALALGWPVIRTFGMTEVCSQLASARGPGLELEVLPIHQIRIDQDQRLTVKSEALFTLQFEHLGKVTLASELSDPEGFYLTQDRATYEKGKFLHLGRLDDQIKISGRLISFNEIKDLLSDYALKNGIYEEVEVILESDERKGLILVLLYLKRLEKKHLNPLGELFHPLQIDQMREVGTFQRTDLGKLIK